MHALPGTEEIFSAEDRNVAIKKEKETMNEKCRKLRSKLNTMEKKLEKSNLNVKNLRSDCKKLLKEKKSAFQNQMGHLSEMVNGGSFIIFK
ncbi:Uncharacterized protein APZ42_010617 [Daphnia magna]|uniref:Uncharacterized protein n=1 Tax=Daphnia magna TaxID=35525 RepID=A0A164DAW8_9CRUS|nr:Uncharacterized protein APZ42_010617 [Daphnia magna]